MLTVLVALHGPAPTPEQSASWRGLTVAPEVRCTLYDSADYRYSQDLGRAVIAGLGGRIYGPYTGRNFSRPTETETEHIVARSEAHDSGLCDAHDTVERRFANDLLNITLTSPEPEPWRKERPGCRRMDAAPE